MLSPCKNKCKLNDKGTHCVGCKRSKEEIRRWPHYTESERYEIMRQLGDRK